MSADDPARLDPRAVRRAFDRASHDYDRHALLHATAREEILGRLAQLKLEPSVVLDLGAGTGHGARALKARYGGARVIALDFAPEMLRAARARQSLLRRFDRIHGDALSLPLGSGSVDLVYSNLLLHWSSDIDRLLAEVRRVLAPRGYFTFSTVGPDTLRELRAAFGEVDGAAHVHRFLDAHDVGNALARAGFADPVIDIDRYTLTYASVGALVAELRSLGARNALAARPRGLAGRGRRARLEAAYARLRQPDGRYPASCELVYGQAWCPATPPLGSSRRGEVFVPLGALRHRRAPVR